MDTVIMGGWQSWGVFGNGWEQIEHCLLLGGSLGMR